jgi:hypothetical protein
MYELAIGAIIAALIFDFVNGFNDARDRRVRHRVLASGRPPGPPGSPVRYFLALFHSATCFSILAISSAGASP